METFTETLKKNSSISHVYSNEPRRDLQHSLEEFSKCQVLPPVVVHWHDIRTDTIRDILYVLLIAPPGPLPPYLQSYFEILPPP